MRLWPSTSHLPCRQVSLGGWLVGLIEGLGSGVVTIVGEGIALGVGAEEAVRVQAVRTKMKSMNACLKGITFLHHISQVKLITIVN